MLTSAQLVILRADILADPTFATIPQTPDGAFAIADVYNLTAVPDYWVWRTSVTKENCVQETSSDGTTFNWTGAGFITRTQGERDAWHELFDVSGRCNASLPNVRQAFLDIFSGGTVPAPANRTHLATIARRKATRSEKLYATGTGSTASPATMVFEGLISYQEVERARTLP